MLAMKMHSEGSPEISNPKLNSWIANPLWFEPVTFRWIRGKHLTTKAHRPYDKQTYNDEDACAMCQNKFVGSTPEALSINVYPKNCKATIVDVLSIISCKHKFHRICWLRYEFRLSRNNNLLKYPMCQGRRALVVKYFPRIHRKRWQVRITVGSLSMNSASGCLFPEILPSAFSLPAFMYSA